MCLSNDYSQDKKGAYVANITKKLEDISVWQNES